MSYQIKRTPFYRRIFNKSRRNGQLQRLREEYERIQEFNDNTIELKMRQVRLKRLFREIEDINESPGISTATRRQSPMLPLTPEEQQAQHRRERLEGLERARELGVEISRRNAQLAESGSGYYLRSELRLTSKMRAAEEARRDAMERRQRAARRISYGNAQSRSNIERIALRRQRRESEGANSFVLDTANQVAQLPSQQLHPDSNKRSMLQQRLQYGNSRSSNNMMRSQIAAAQRVLQSISISEEGGQAEPNQLSSISSRSNITSTTTANITNNLIPNNNTNTSGNLVESETEMLTAMLLPSEPDALRIMPLDDDDMPTTSQNALRLADMRTNISIRQQQLLHSSNCEQMNDRASENWRRVSLTLPWIKVINDSHLIASAANEPPPAQLTDITFTMGGDELIHNNHNSINSCPTAVPAELDDGSNTSNTGNTEHFQSFHEPSLLQEDLMQIIELDDKVQLPTMNVEHRTT